jgi:polyhydroxyalkanoate synthase
VFLLSWRNPGPEQAEWDIDTYAGRIRSAVDVVKDIADVEDVNTLGFCAGGILMTTVLSHLAAQGDDSVHSASYGVTLLDFGTPAPIGAFSAPRMLELAPRQFAPFRGDHGTVTVVGVQLDAPGRPGLQLRRQQLVDG